MRIFCFLIALNILPVCLFADEQSDLLKERINSEFQRATVGWMTRDVSWLNSWQFRQLSKLPTGYDVAV